MENTFDISVILPINTSKVKDFNDFFNKSNEHQDLEQYAEVYANKIPVNIPRQRDPGQIEREVA